MRYCPASRGSCRGAAFRAGPFLIRAGVVRRACLFSAPLSRRLHNSRVLTGFSEPAYSKGPALQKLGANKIHSKQRWRFRRPRPPLTPRCPKLPSVLPYDRCGRFKPNADAAALIDISALGGDSTDGVLGGQYRCHVAATLTGRLPSHAIIGVNRFSTASLQFTRVIPEIDIWRAANLMLKRYGEKVLDESGTRAHELAADGDHDGASTWRRITAAVEQLANNIPPGPVN
jgi:hypothetical protein